MVSFEDALKGGDLRSIGNSNKVVNLIQDHHAFDKLFNLLYHSEKQVVMRAGDAIEKVTIRHPEYLHSHKKEIIKICDKAIDIELKWHLAQLLPRLSLTKKEGLKAWNILFNWASNKNESKIVRVNSLQSLYTLLPGYPEHKEQFDELIFSMYKENIPSINARLKKLGNARL